MAELKQPLRMCIICRARLEKNLLLRLKCEDKKLVPYDNYGRSFYICFDCIDKAPMQESNSKEYRKLERALYKQCKNKDEYVVQLKEILTDVR